MCSHEDQHENKIDCNAWRWGKIDIELAGINVLKNCRLVNSDAKFLGKLFIKD